MARLLFSPHISIHAPVKGATGGRPEAAQNLPISIHAPVKGATVLGFLCSGGTTDFNPRSRKGSDRFS